MKWNVEFRATGWINFDVEADTEDEAVSMAWQMFETEGPHDAEWDVIEVSELRGKSCEEGA